MSATPVVVVGGDGLVGRAVCRVLSQTPDASSSSAVVRRAPSGDLGIAHQVVDVGALDADLESFRHARTVIWVAGGADHGLGDRDPTANLATNVTPLLAMLEVFRGNLVLLSSQAVYSGLLASGVDEYVDHIPNMAYGLAKLVAERHAMWARDRGELSSLWVYRLMYTFGPGEKPRRLIPRLVAAAGEQETVSIGGGGRSFLNPLPVHFLAEVLLRSATDLAAGAPGITHITNVCHPRATQVREVVELVRDRTGVLVTFHDDGESWPVHFQGSPDRLADHLSGWGLAFPDPLDSIADYVTQLQKEEVV